MGTKFIILLTTVSILSGCSSITPLESPHRPLIIRSAEEIPNGVLGPSSKHMRVHVLNIAAGNCVFVECPNSDDVLIFDCGSNYPTGCSMNAEDVRSYFESLAGNDEPTVVLSHSDGDHTNLIPGLLVRQPAERFSIGQQVSDYRGKIRDILERALHSKKVFEHDQGYSSGDTSEDHLECGDAKTWIATVNIGDSDNSQSLIALLSYGEFRIVFSGDAEGDTEAAAMRSMGKKLKGVDVLLASHHGAHTKESNSESWIRHTKPSTVIYSSGIEYGHPSTRVVERYQEHGNLKRGKKKHLMWSARRMGERYRRYESDLAEYVTELTGVITIDVDASGQYTIRCERGC